LDDPIGRSGGAVSMGGARWILEDSRKMSSPRSREVTRGTAEASDGERGGLLESIRMIRGDAWAAERQ